VCELGVVDEPVTEGAVDTVGYVVVMGDGAAAMGGCAKPACSARPATG